MSLHSSPNGQPRTAEGVDRAALVFAGVAAATTLISGSGAWTPVSTVAGIAILLILIAFYSPAPSKHPFRWMCYHMAFGLVFSLGVMASLAFFLQPAEGDDTVRGIVGLNDAMWPALVVGALAGAVSAQRDGPSGSQRVASVNTAPDRRR